MAETGLEAEFTRLFLGPGRPVAPVHESVYREGRVMGETSLAVRRHLAGEGLAETLTRYMKNPSKMREMGKRAKQMARPNAAAVIAGHLLEMATRT